MTSEPRLTVLEAILDAWDRNNEVLVNLIRALPDGGLAARATEGSPTVAEMLTHMHHERMVSALEEVPESHARVPTGEWVGEADRERIVAMLVESAATVRKAILGRVDLDRQTDLNFDHPVQLICFLIFHEGYHHGQIKLALKASGRPIEDREAGPLTWGVWRRRT